jgi:aryl-alcohol dehydrogenase-like predicted oxidoreductase
MQFIEIPGFSRPISRVILGTGTWEVSRAAVFHEITDAYVNNGGNTIDTARFYGNDGKSELVLADWLQKTGMRKNLNIIDKACHAYVSKTGHYFNDRNRVYPQVITDDLYTSLERIKTDYFDIYLLHRDNPEVPVGELMDRLEEHRQEGLIRSYGVSNWTMNRIKEAMEYCNQKDYNGISVDSPSYSLAVVTTPRWHNSIHLTDEDARWHKKMNLPIFTWGGLANGFFSDRTDIQNAPGFKKSYFTKDNIEKRKRAIEIAEKRCTSSTIIALAYVLCMDVPLAAVIGTSNKKRLLDNLSALDISLTPEEMSYLNLSSDNLG